ncbi:CRISPR-associated helicase/endonuclease Cas3 [Spirochaetia bacterium]|nr:CRISPR-associated helicase/endonuclease Cas3 [Spirochaetia bacterium]
MGEVAKALIQRFIPEIREKYFPPGSELVAAVHDIGKVSPCFQEKIYRATTGYRSNSLPGLEYANPDQEKNWDYHPGVSLAALDGRDPSTKAGKYIPEIAGRHHGLSARKKYSATSEYFGGESWQQLREDSTGKLKEYFCADWPEVKDDFHAAVLSGLTSVADWIGSSSAFDGFKHIEEINDLPARVDTALKTAGFIPPVFRQDLSFKDIFSFDPRPAQSLFIESLSAPGVYVLEAPMGMGKTEAALYAAYKIMQAGKASGIYFALPTRLTSDKIYERMNKFLSCILDEKSPLRKSLLLHSSAWIYEAEMGEEGQPGASWFHAKKRGILAPFAVGTIDQALMAVMNVKHGFVRAFGLAGKVVILDEVHSYDSYTGTIMDELVRGLRKMECTVIILSATLTDERRRTLLQLPEKTQALLSHYPLISLVDDGEEDALRPVSLYEIPVPVTDKIEVAICIISNDGDAVEEALKRAEQGQQVLWIENTVKEAQARYLQLSARAVECGIKTGLLHSWFVQNDRSYNENYWVELFGKNAEARYAQGRILVGTQVLEQSLDIDADFLVTRLCPTDMLLQRIGRLWRHRENDPVRPEDARSEVWILSARYEQVLANYKKELGKSVFVYAPYVLLRTLEVWEDQTVLNLPGDIRRLVELTYQERSEDGLPGKLKHDLEKERDRLRRFALLGLSLGGKTLPESKAETRYSDRETRDLLLLQSAKKNQDGSISIVFSDTESLELKKGLKNRDKNLWRRTAAILSRYVVTVPKNKAPLPTPEWILDWFSECIYIGTEENEEGRLRIALVKKSGKLVGIDSSEVSRDYFLSYDKVCGYSARKKADTYDEEDW